MRKHRQMTSAEQALFGIDKLNVARSEIPAVTAGRWFTPAPQSIAWCCFWPSTLHIRA
jgi:hypothetical protein